MDLHTQSAFFLAVFGIVISIVAADRNRPAQGFVPFLILTTSFTVWAIGYATYKLTGAGYQISHAGALFLPCGAIWMTRSLLQGRGPIGRTVVVASAAVALAGLAVLLFPGLAPGGGELHRRFLTSIGWQLAGAAYVFVPVLACLFAVFARKGTERSMVNRRRLTLIFYAGFITAMVGVLEYANRWGMDFPPLTKVAIIFFLYVLYQSGVLYRSFSVQEVVGKVVVVFVSALVLAGIYGALVYWVGNDPVLFVFNTLAASFVILVLYEPVISRIESSTVDLIFRRRNVFQHALQQAANRMANLVRAADLQAFVVHEIPRLVPVQRSRLLVAQKGYNYLRSVAAGEGDDADFTVVDDAETLSFLAGLTGPLTVVDLDARIQSAGTGGLRPILKGVRRIMEEQTVDLMLPLRSQDALRGLWGLKSSDDGGFTFVEAELLDSLATQIAIQMENVRIYERLLQQERLATLGEMAAGLAHEIKNPLGTLKGAAQLIDASSVSEKDGGFLRIIVEESDRLNAALGRFLEYARPDEPVLDGFDLNDLVERTVEQFALGVDRALVRIERDLDERVGTVRCDGEQIKQVLINLLHNAHQSLDGEGRISVRTRQEGRRREFVRILVEDTGRGIDPETLPRIFEPFFTTRRSGSGLGLAISKRIVEAHGGGIDVESRSGRATRFTIRLPTGQDG